MRDMTVHLELPRELLGTLGVSEADLSAALKTLIALELVRQGRISAGKAAELAGVSRVEFVQLMADQDISYFTETPEDLAAQVEAAGFLLKGKPF